MAESPGTIGGPTSTNAPSGAQAKVKRQRWLEVCLVLLVAFGPFILSAIKILTGGPNAAPYLPNARWSAGVLQESTALLLLLYVLSRRRLQLRDIGLRWSLRDVGAGLMIAVASFAAYSVGSWVVRLAHYWLFGSLTSGPSPGEFLGHPSVAVILFFLLNPFFEELIARAYLMTEVLGLTGSPILAVALSVAVQFSYHLYYGWTGAISVSFQFLVFAVYFVLSRRALPVIVAHGLFDIWGLVRLW